MTGHYTNDDILLIATDSSLPGFDRSATVVNLEWAITQWAPSQLEPHDPVTLYLVDHGDPNRIYLDLPNGQVVTAGLLNQWLNQLEAAVPGVKINVIIETCKSGSFVTGPQSIARPGRVIVTSTNSTNDAYASLRGARFSDHFITALYGSSLSSSFWQAAQAVTLANSLQIPWLDADGDGIPNELADMAIASRRGFGFPGTFGEPWPPYIAQVDGPPAVQNRRGVLQAKVYNDIQVRTVWAVIYAPSYVPPAPGNQLVAEILPTVLLQPQGNDWYATEYRGFDEIGTYRIVVHATDDKDPAAQPVVLTVKTGEPLYLPLQWKQ